MTPDEARALAAEKRAVEACMDYAKWNMEKIRLHKAIADAICPEEYHGDENDGYAHQSSCFSSVAAEEVPCGSISFDEPDMRRPTLDEIEADEEVQACEVCSKLPDLIRKRWEARAELGKAKRRVHYAGKAILALKATGEIR